MDESARGTWDRNRLTGRLDDPLLLDSIVENIPHMIFVKDAKELRFVRINRAGEELLGLTREDLIGKNDHDFFPREQADFFISKDREVLEGRKLVDIPEEPIHTRKRGRRFLHTKKIPLLDADGEPEFLLGISHDITERKLAEDQIRLQSEIFRNLIEGVVIVSATDGTMLSANPAFERNFGYEPDELVGEHVRVLHSGTRQVSADRAAERVIASARSEGIFSGEIRTKRKDGSEFWSWVRITTVEREGFDPIWVCVQSDLTERKAAEERVRRAERLASIGTLAAGLAHEINNPVGAILLHAETALLHCPSNAKSGPEERARANLEQIIQQAERCGRIVRSVLKFAKEEATERWPADLNENVLRARNLLRREMGHRKLEVETRIDDAIPKVRFNPTEIDQVLQNVLRNAAQSHGNDLKIRISTGTTPTTVRLVIEDNGPGVPEDQRARVFDPFYTTRQQKGGSGLGLSIVHGIIKSHGGSIQLDTSPLGGARIVIDLPRDDGEEGE